MGGMHAQIYRQLNDVELVAAVGLEPELARAKLLKMGWDVPIYGDLEQLLARHEVDVIDICTPTDEHAVLAKTAIRAGKHLFCEKPLALTLEEAESIESEAEAAGIFAQVGHCIRFWPEYMALRKFADSGRGGKLLNLHLVRRASRPAYSENNWLNLPHRSGGAALDLHIHDTDFVHHLLGQPTAVTSRMSEGKFGPDHIHTLYHFDDCVVSAEGGWNYPPQWGFQMAFDAVFEKAAISYDSLRKDSLLITLESGETQPMPFEEPSSGHSSVGEGNLSSLSGYFNELQYFFACLKENRRPEVATLRQACISLKTTLTEIRSARLGQTLALK